MGDFKALCVLLSASISFSLSNAADCGTQPPFALGCPCDASAPRSAKQCVDGVKCSGNTTIYGTATCGGETNTLICPGAYGNDTHEFWVQNTTADYCANTQIRTCSDPNGCVGVKYRNDTSIYSRCAEYGNPTTGHFSDGGLSLPMKVRIPKDTTYITFVCDPEPGNKVPIVSEYWPAKPSYSNGTWLTGWPKSMPPMGKGDCSECTGSGICPWPTDGPSSGGSSQCNCCTRCTPDDGTYPPQYNITLSNPTQHPWKVLLSLPSPGGGYPYLPSTCVLRHAFTDCDGWRPGHCPGSLVDEYQQSVDPTQATQVPPGAENFVIGIPAKVESITIVPMYTSVLSACVVEGMSEGYAPRAIGLKDTLGGQDCAVTRAKM